LNSKVKQKIGWGLIAFSVVTTLIIVVTSLHNAAVRDRVLADPLDVTAVIVDIVVTYQQQPGAHDLDFYDDHNRRYTRRVYVEYEVGGQSFREHLGWWSNSFRIGQPVDIIVNRANPREFINANEGPEWLGIVIMLIFVVIFGGGSGITGVVLIRTAKRGGRNNQRFDGNIPHSAEN